MTIFSKFQPFFEDKPTKMSSNHLSHFPVMVNEAISFLKPENEKTYLDCTFGQGGYSKMILENSKCNIIAIDRDQDSEIYAREMKDKFKSRFIFNIDRFSNIDLLMKKYKIKNMDGMILDLGVSNTQLNNPDRGFSFSKEGPLDMRMDNISNKLTAEIIVNEYQENELSDIFFYYGEEKNSKRIAREIINYRKKKKIDSTKILSEIIKKISYDKFKHPATRVFQALRIFINEELDELESILELSKTILNKESRIVVVSFHSLEDRIVKNFFRKNKVKENKLSQDSYSSNEFCFKIITKKPVTPSSNEIKLNPRSRSAKMRVAEKI